VARGVAPGERPIEFPGGAFESGEAMVGSMYKATCESEQPFLEQFLG
jgi:hypothetical protein